MKGKLVLVVGPSGAGKDSLIDAAKKHFTGDANFVFPRRVITRHATQAAEDHDTLSPEAFLRAQAQGAFFLDWQAHDLSYGLPASMGDDLRLGKVVIVNVSRTVLAKAAEVWPNTTVIVVTAPPHILAARVSARARKEDGDIQKRISRSIDAPTDTLPRIIISNDRTLEEAAQEFYAAINGLIAHEGFTQPR